MLFCYDNRIINHLFFNCQFALAIWGLFKWSQIYTLLVVSLIWLVFGYRVWTKSLNGPLVLLRAKAMCWALWHSQNNIILEQKYVTSPWQVIYMSIHWFVHDLFYRSLKFMIWSLLHVTIWSRWSPRGFLRHMGGNLVFRLYTTSVHLVRSFNFLF